MYVQAMGEKMVEGDKPGGQPNEEPPEDLATRRCVCAAGSRLVACQGGHCLVICSVAPFRCACGVLGR